MNKKKVPTKRYTLDFDGELIETTTLKLGKNKSGFTTPMPTVTIKYPKTNKPEINIKITYET